MSAVVHYSAALDGIIPKRFLCGKKCKGGNEWTRQPWLVECARCNAKLRDGEAVLSRSDRKAE